MKMYETDNKSDNKKVYYLKKTSVISGAKWIPNLKYD